MERTIRVRNIPFTVHYGSNLEVYLSCEGRKVETYECESSDEVQKTYNTIRDTLFAVKKALGS